MTIRFACPGCQKTLSVPDQYAGRKSKCPGCSAALMVPAANGAGNVMAAPNVSGPAAGSWLPPGVGQAPAMAPSAAVTTSPAATPQWPAPAPSGAGGPIAPEWGSVATGLRLMKWASILKILVAVGMFLLYVAMFVLMGATLLAVLGSASGSAGPRGGPSDETAANAAKASILGFILVLGGFAVAGLTLFVQYILQIIGGILTCRAPQDSGARGLGFGVLFCILTPIFVMLFVAAANLIKLPILGLVGYGGWGIVFMAEWVLFIMFMHRVGTALDSAELRAKAVSFAIWIGVNIACRIAASCLIGIMLYMSFASIMAAIGNATAPDGTSEAATGFSALAIVGVVVIVGTALAILIVDLVLLIKYFGMMNSGIRTIRQRLAGAALA
jgi:hypothetical protein